MPSTVLEVLAQRRATGDKNDGYKLGLVVEGGGMRGVITAGALAYLCDHDMLQFFDVGYGQSAGALNLCYAAAGRPWRGISVYYDHLATNRFIAYTRRAQKQPIMDLHLVRNEVITNLVPLSYSDTLAGPIPLMFDVSDLNNAETRTLTISDCEDQVTFRDYLVAGCHIPIMAGPPPRIEGTDLADGALFRAHPVYIAEADNATHVLSLESRLLTAGERLGWVEPFVARALDQFNPVGGARYLNAAMQYYEDRDKTGLGTGSLRGMQVERLALELDRLPVRRDTLDRFQLLEGVRLGYTMAERLFDPGAAPSVFRVVSPEA